MIFPQNQFAIFQDSFLLLLHPTTKLAYPTGPTVVQLQWPQVLKPILSDWAEFHAEETDELPNIYEGKLSETYRLDFELVLQCVQM